MNFDYMTRVETDTCDEVFETCGFRLEVLGDDINAKVVISKIERDVEDDFSIDDWNA